MTSPPRNTEERPASWFSPKIEAGHVIQAALVVVGIITWAVTSKNNVDNAQNNLSELKVTMNAEFAKISNSQDRTKEELLREIRNNPTVDRHFSDIERWISAQEAYRTAHDQRIGAIEQADARMRAELDGILRASNTPIRNAR